MSNLPRILVTGASGYIGRQVVASLQGRAEVLTPVLDGMRVDLLEPEQRAALITNTRPEILIHLAWVTEHGAFWGSPLNADWLEASKDLFSAFYAHGGRRTIATGTCAEYDWTTGTERFPEDAPLAPHTDYGRAKVLTAAALQSSADHHGAEWAWGRVFFSFGPGEPRGRLIPLMLDTVRNHGTLDIGPGATTRDFWPIQTLGASIAALALSPVQGPVNLGAGHGTHFADLVDMIEQISGRTGLIRTDSRPLGAGEPMALVPDTRKLVHEVGFTDQPNLKDALAAYYHKLA